MTACSQVALSSHRVIIVDDHDLAREGLRVLLAGAPDLALMDVRLPDMDGLEATRAGASAYLLKGASRHELLEAIDHALHG